MKIGQRVHSVERGVSGTLCGVHIDHTGVVVGVVKSSEYARYRRVPMKQLRVGQRRQEKKPAVPVRIRALTRDELAQAKLWKMTPKQYLEAKEG